MIDQDKSKPELIEELAEMRRRVAVLESAESEMQRSEERYRLLTEAVPQMLWRADPDRQTIECNPLWYEYTGQTPEEAQGFGWMAALHPDDVTQVTEHVREALTAGQPYQAEYRVRRTSDGSYRWHLSRVLPMKDKGGKITSWFGSVTDIHDQKQAEEALRASEVKYRRLHESMRDAFASVAMDGRILEYNEAYRMMLGYEPEELFKLCYQELTPEKWHSYEAEIVQKQILALGHSDVYEKEYRRKDGTIFPVELRTFLIKDDHGQSSAMWAIVRDITDRKRAEEALKKVHDELEQWVKEARLNEARLEAVLQLNHMTEASLKGIADFALEQAVALTESKLGYVAFMNEDETVLTMHSWSKEAMAECAISDKPLVYPVISTGLWGEAARQRKPIVTNDYAAPNLLKKGIPEGHVGLRCHMNVPIIDEGRIVIVAGVGNKETDYNESDVRQLTLLMKGVWTLIQRHRMQADLRQHRDHLEQLVEERTQSLWKMLQASDHERQIISYEIHDGLAQYLAAAGMQFQAYDYLKENMPVEAQKAYETAVELVHQAHAESRRLINEVRPPVIDEIGLETAISHLVHEQRKLGGPKIKFDSDVQFNRLPPILENALYRIVQEALTNACKHSKSRNCLLYTSPSPRD